MLAIAMPVHTHANRKETETQNANINANLQPLALTRNRKLATKKFAFSTKQTNSKNQPPLRQSNETLSRRDTFQENNTLTSSQKQTQPFDQTAPPHFRIPVVDKQKRDSEPHNGPTLAAVQTAVHSPQPCLNTDKNLCGHKTQTLQTSARINT